MSQDFQQVYVLPKELCAAGVPVIIAAGDLTKSNKTGKVFARLKLRNVSPNEKKMTAVKVRLDLFDPAGNPLGQPVQYQYLDIVENPNKEFGSQKLIMLDELSARSFHVEITELVYHDGEVLTFEENRWESLGLPKRLEVEMGGDLAAQYRRDTTEKSKFFPAIGQTVWRCACGTLNSSSEDLCYHCGSIKEELQAALDSERLQQNLEGYWEDCRCRDAYGNACRVMENETSNIGDYRRAVAALESVPGWLDADERLEVCRMRLERLIEEKRQQEAIAREAAAKRKKRNTIVISTLVAVVLAVVLTVTFIIPQVKYNKAAEEVLAGNYDAAIAIYTELSQKEFKDSADKILETKYQKAGVLHQTKEYDAAITIYSELGEKNFSDSANKVHEVKYDKAADLYGQKKYKEASVIFKSLYSYKDGKAKFADSVWLYASELIEQEDWLTALTELSQLTADLQTVEVVTKKSECNAMLAQIAYDKGQYENAQAYYLKTIDADKTSDFYKDCTYQTGLDQMQKKAYQNAVKTFEELGYYKDSVAQKNLAMYSYVTSHKNSSDNTTYDYLKKLRNIGYKDSGVIYNDLFKWKIQYTIFNDDINDTRTDNSSQSTYQELVFHVKFSSGPQGGGKIHYVLTWTGGDGKNSGEWWCIKNKDYTASFSFDIPSRGRTGRYTFSVYDENWALLGSKTVQIYR